MLSSLKLNPNKETRFLIINPHGADFRLFKSRFPEICEHKKVKSRMELFQLYLAIERDLGATELAHSIASSLAKNFEIGVEIISIDYPRGIVDGGRDPQFAIRSALPDELLSDLSERFKDIHIDATSTIEAKILATPQDCIILDVHTMSTFEYLRELDGKKIPDIISWETMEQYVRSFTEAMQVERPLNILCRDESDSFKASQHIVAELKATLTSIGIRHEEDNPYRILKRYKSHLYFGYRRGLAVDIPKSYLCKDQSIYSLEKLEVDQSKVDNWGKIIAEVLLRSSNLA